MKKVFSLMLCCALLFSIPLAVMAETMYVETTTGSGVHMRADRSVESDVLRTVPYGAAVDLMETIPGNLWGKVSYDGTTGYIMLKFLTAVKPAPKPTAKPGPAPTKRPSESTNLDKMFTGFETTHYEALVVPATPSGFVNLRWAPSKSAPVRGKYYANSVMEVKSTNGEWSEVHDAQNDVYGFMQSHFLTPTSGNGITLESQDT